MDSIIIIDDSQVASAQDPRLMAVALSLGAAAPETCLPETKVSVPSPDATVPATGGNAGAKRVRADREAWVRLPQRGWGINE